MEERLFTQDHNTAALLLVRPSAADGNSLAPNVRRGTRKDGTQIDPRNPSSEASRRPLRVVLVDDSPAFVESARQFLDQDSRIDIVGIAASGEAALEAVEHMQPDLVLMDVSMPGMNGLEATKRIKARPDAGCLVIIVTLNESAVYAEAVATAGADGFVAKADFVTHLLPLIDSLFDCR